MNKRTLSIMKNQPICVGTGLVALDVVFNGKPQVPPRLWAGGSCGNVLTILSYLGWISFPVIRIGDDEPAKRLLKDWGRFGVCREFVDMDKTISTPIIVEQIIMGSTGSPTHRFHWVCPNCGAWFPRYRAILLTMAKKAINQISMVNCFYFDRVSPGAIALAMQAKKSGALIFFEPPSIKNNDNMFERAIEICDILKVANGRTYEGGILDSVLGPSLIIQTLGEEGIRYRIGNKDVCRVWKRLPPFPVLEFKDAAGAGDWCSAGIIFSLCGKGSSEIKNCPEKKIIKALEFGQAMAALNCRYEGARGGMYAMNKNEFQLSIEQVLRSRIVVNSAKEELSHDVTEMFSCLCPGCRKKGEGTKTTGR